MFTESERGYVALKKLEEETTEGGIWIVRTLGNLGNTIGDIRNGLGMLLKRGRSSYRGISNDEYLQK